MRNLYDGMIKIRLALWVSFTFCSSAPMTHRCRCVVQHLSSNLFHLITTWSTEIQTCDVFAFLSALFISGSQYGYWLICDGRRGKRQWLAPARLLTVVSLDVRSHLRMTTQWKWQLNTSDDPTVTHRVCLITYQVWNEVEENTELISQSTGNSSIYKIILNIVHFLSEMFCSSAQLLWKQWLTVSVFAHISELINN